MSEKIHGAKIIGSNKIGSGLYVGTAGWSVSGLQSDRFQLHGTHLERYSHILTALEINSSFYRPHRLSTYRKWADCVPAHFRFSVKIPKHITHESALTDCNEPLTAFIDQVSGLGRNLGPLLVQLPPSNIFNETVVDRFYKTFRRLFSGLVVCEPRHGSWFSPEAHELLRHYCIARVAADPSCVALAAKPGGWPGIIYYRWHGSPIIYRSEYGQKRIALLDKEIRSSTVVSPAWCIFDNTALGAALKDSLALLDYHQRA